MTTIEEITLEKWEEIHKFQKEGWVYRGQSNSKDPLKTSLERTIYRFHDDLCKQVKKEKILLREFKRRYHQYSLHIPEDKDYLEWFSIMRHYDAPVRLLDFSYSIYIAAYFALEHGKKDCAVWAIDSDWSGEQSKLILNLPGDYWKKIDDDDRERQYMTAVFENKNPKPCVTPINPFRLTERLTLQQGVFVCPSNINMPVMDNLTKMEGHDNPDHVVKIIIPKELRRDAMENLRRMNINRATLFPGLDGFAKSLDVFGPVFED